MKNLFVSFPPRTKPVPDNILSNMTYGQWAEAARKDDSSVAIVLRTTHAWHLFRKDLPMATFDERHNIEEYYYASEPLPLGTIIQFIL